MTPHLVKTRGAIRRMEQAEDTAGAEVGFWSFRTCSASPQCSAESARCPTHTAVRGLALHPRSAHAGRMDAAVEWPRLCLSRSGRPAATTCACPVYLGGSLASAACCMLRALHGTERSILHRAKPTASFVRWKERAVSTSPSYSAPPARRVEASTVGPRHTRCRTPNACRRPGHSKTILDRSFVGKVQSRALGAQIHVISGVNTMSHVTYKIVQHDGGWAYKVGDVFSESYLSRTDAHAAAEKAAREQHTPGETTSIEFEDPSGHWRQEIASGNDRPETDVED